MHDLEFFFNRALRFYDSTRFTQFLKYELNGNVKTVSFYDGRIQGQYTPINYTNLDIYSTKRRKHDRAKLDLGIPES